MEETLPCPKHLMGVELHLGRRHCMGGGYPLDHKWPMHRDERRLDLMLLMMPMALDDGGMTSYPCGGLKG